MSYVAHTNWFIRLFRNTAEQLAIHFKYIPYCFGVHIFYFVVFHVLQPRPEFDVYLKGMSQSNGLLWLMTKKGSVFLMYIKVAFGDSHSLVP